MKYIPFLLMLICIAGIGLLPGCPSSDPATPEPIDSTKLFSNPPAGSSKSLVRIVQVDANPKGTGDSTESFLLKNFGASPVTFKDWWIRKPRNTNAWSLFNGVILDSGKLYRLHSSFANSLSNDGDTLFLIDGDIDTIQTVIYGKLPDGETVTPK